MTFPPRGLLGGWVVRRAGVLDKSWRQDTLRLRATSEKNERQDKLKNAPGELGQYQKEESKTSPLWTSSFLICSARSRAQCCLQVTAMRGMVLTPALPPRSGLSPHPVYAVLP